MPAIALLGAIACFSSSGEPGFDAIVAAAVTGSPNWPSVEPQFSGLPWPGVRARQAPLDTRLAPN